MDTQTDVGAPDLVSRVGDIELAMLLEAIYLRYHQDFRDYARASLKRRVAQALLKFDCASISRLQERLLHEPATFTEFLRFVTVQVSEMFRDPPFFRSMREIVVPVLATYPSVKIWVAGCSSGEEAYSYAIMLREEGLLDRTIIYATDISSQNLEQAQAGVYNLDRIAQFSLNYQRAGGRRSLADYCAAAYGAAKLDQSLKARMVFSDHSLSTDSVFTEVQLISCRNVLIYFDKKLQDRAIGLFRDSLCRKGFLGLGSKESLRFARDADAFGELVRAQRIYQKC
ncbi:MAG: CheR family methyltransferase [Betaproteobacteria bacterium]